MKFPNIRKVYLLDRLFPPDDNKDFVVNIKYTQFICTLIKINRPLCAENHNQPTEIAVVPSIFDDFCTRERYHTIIIRKSTQSDWFKLFQNMTSLFENQNQSERGKN